jgi:aquaporin Z
MRKYLTEFIGTFFLVLTICLMTNPKIGPNFGGALTPLAVGSALMVMVYMGGHVSGGHYNPAVSLAVLLRGRLGLVDFVFYMIAQVLGAMAACGVAHLILASRFPLAPATTTTVEMAVLVEALFTFALALVVLNVATSTKTEGNSYYGLAIGFTILVAAFAGGPISGGAFNPAVGTGLIVTDVLLAKGVANDLWIYWAGPMVGGLVAAVVYRLQQEPPEIRAGL